MANFFFQNIAFSNESCANDISDDADYIDTYLAILVRVISVCKAVELRTIAEVSRYLQYGLTYYSLLVLTCSTHFRLMNTTWKNQFHFYPPVHL